jgi:hypothetical protein
MSHEDQKVCDEHGGTRRNNARPQPSDPTLSPRTGGVRVEAWLMLLTPEHDTQHVVLQLTGDNPTQIWRSRSDFIRNFAL